MSDDISLFTVTLVILLFHCSLHLGSECANTSHCTDADPNKVCNDGFCVCAPGWSDPHNTSICTDGKSSAKVTPLKHL